MLLNCRPGQLRDEKGRCGPGISLGKARVDMPQIPSSELQAFVEWCGGRGVAVSSGQLLALDLKPVQSEFDQDKVDSLDSDAPVLVSSEHRILDGTHRWVKKWQENPAGKIDVIRVKLPWKEALGLMRGYPGAVLNSLVVNPFVSEAQRRWMHANHPEMAERWEKHTPKGKKLPKRKKQVQNKKRDQLTSRLNVFVRKLKVQFAGLRKDLLDYVGKSDSLGLVKNVFCPTGEGGGVDASCSPGGGRVASMKAAAEKVKFSDKPVKTYLPLLNPEAYDEVDLGADFSNAVLDSWNPTAGGHDNVYRFKTSASDGYEIRATPSAERIGGAAVTHIAFTDATENIEITGKGHAMEVFSKVVPAVTAYVQKMDSDAVAFSSGDASRSKLYDRLTKAIVSSDRSRFVITYKINQAKYYLVARRAMRESIEEGLKKVGVESHDVLVNVFCATGPGGGIDATCSPNGPQFTKLQAHKIKVLNPGGPQNGVLKIPKSLDDAQQGHLRTLHPGAELQVVSTGHIKLSTPVPQAPKLPEPEKRGEDGKSIRLKEAQFGYVASFAVGEAKYNVEFNKSGRDKYTVSFHQEGPGGITFRQTNEQGMAAIRVFRQVGNAMDQFLAQVKPERFEFSAAKDEPTRVKLYDKISTMLSSRHGYAVTVDDSLRSSREYVFTKLAGVQNRAFRPFLEEWDDLVLNEGSECYQLIEVPDVRQEDNHECGAAAALCVAQHFGVDGGMTLQEMADELGTTVERSTHPSAIVEFFLQRGLQVEARSNLSIADLRSYQAREMPVIVPLQDYMGDRDPKAEFDYGHYLTIVGAYSGYVFCQDSAFENLEHIAGGDVKRDIEEASLAAPGRKQVYEDDFLDAWHDDDIEGHTFYRFGIAVGFGVVNSNPEGCNQYKPCSTTSKEVTHIVPIDTLFEHGEAGSLTLRYSDRALKEMAEDLKKNGMREPIKMIGPGEHEDPETARSYVGDGRHRLEAAKLAGFTHVPVRVGQSGKLGSRFNAAPVQNSLIVNAPPFPFPSDPARLEAFQRWLRTRSQQHLRGATQEQLWAEFIQDGFRRGAGRAFDDAHRGGRALAQTDQRRLDFHEGTRSEFLRSSFARPVAQERVELVASRAFDEMEAVTDDMSNRMSRALADAMVRGASPREAAHAMADELDIAEGRALTIARTELIRAHAEGQLTGLENLGVQHVGVEVEWHATDDDKTCDYCDSMDGVVLPISEAHGLLPRHPNCRCAWIPANVGEDEDEQKRTDDEIDSAFAGADYDRPTHNAVEHLTIQQFDVGKYSLESGLETLLTGTYQEVTNAESFFARCERDEKGHCVAELEQRQFTKLQLKKIRVLNPDGPVDGKLKVPKGLDDDQLKHVEQKLGVRAVRVQAGHIKLRDKEPEKTAPVAVEPLEIGRAATSRVETVDAFVETPRGYAATQKQMTTLEPKEIKEGKEGINGSFTVKLADGSRGKWKPAENEWANLSSRAAREAIEEKGFRGVPWQKMYIREAAASEVAKLTGFSDLVPPTVVREIGGKVGSLQAFAEGATVATEYHGNEKFDGDKDLARTAAFDYMIGHSDRHGGNWMLKGGKIVLIDNGLSFPVSTEGWNANNLMTKKVEAKRLPVPDMSRAKEAWPKVAESLEKLGIERAAIREAKRRLDTLVSLKGQSFSRVPRAWVKLKGEDYMHHPKQGQAADDL